MKAVQIISFFWNFWEKWELFWGMQTFTKLKAWNVSKDYEYVQKEISERGNKDG